MKKFRFYFLDGTEYEGEGVDVADAFRRLGFSGGAMRALDYYREVKDESAATQGEA